MTNKNFPKASRPATEIEEDNPRSTIARTVVATPQHEKGLYDDEVYEPRKKGGMSIMALFVIMSMSGIAGCMGGLLLYMNESLPFGLQEGIESKLEVTETVTIPTTTTDTEPARTPATAAATPAQAEVTEDGGNPSKNPTFQREWAKAGTKENAIAACTVADGHYDSADPARHELAIIWYSLCGRRFEQADMPQSAAQAQGAVERAKAKAKASGRDLSWLSQIMGGKAVAAELTGAQPTELSQFPNPAPDMGKEISDNAADCYAAGRCF